MKINLWNIPSLLVIGVWMFKVGKEVAILLPEGNYRENFLFFTVVAILSMTSLFYTARRRRQ